MRKTVHARVFCTHWSWSKFCSSVPLRRLLVESAPHNGHSNCFSKWDFVVRDCDEIETYDFKSEMRPRATLSRIFSFLFLRPRPKHFSGCYIQVRCMCVSRLQRWWPVQLTHLFFNNFTSHLETYQRLGLGLVSTDRDRDVGMFRDRETS